MPGIIKKLVIGASIVVGMSALAATPGVAGPMTVVGIEGTAPTDYAIWHPKGTDLATVTKNLANLKIALTGNKSKPTGNVELCYDCDNGKLKPSDYNKKTTVTTLKGRFGTKTIQLSSLTRADWLGQSFNTSYSAPTLAKKWFDAGLKAYGLSQLIGTSRAASIYGSFVKSEALQRLSDPNIAYVSQDKSTSPITIGLAGHYNARPVLEPFLDKVPDDLKPFLPDLIQASEVVKVTYNGKTQYLYSFTATKSGFNNPISATGIYEAKFAP